MGYGAAGVDLFTGLLDTPAAYTGQGTKIAKVKSAETGLEFTAFSNDAALVFIIKDADSTGLKGFLQIPFGCEITGYSILADVAGDIVVDIWKDVFANFPPDVADTITAAAKPELSAAQAIFSTVLTGWTIAIAALDVLGFNIDSVTTITSITITIFVTKT
ncbi:hypothetical protein ES705_34274 [subsurface metagenome]